MNRINSPSSNQIKKLRSVLALLALSSLFCTLLCACTVSSEKIEYALAEEAVQKGDYAGAIVHFKNVVDRYQKTPLAINAAHEAARIDHYQLKNPREAEIYYKHIVLYSSSADERIEAQKKLADIDFTQILDYTEAIVEFSRLLELPHSQNEDFIYRLSIARSYFYLSNFYQAQVEIETVLKRNYDKDLIFEALLLKANIYLTTKSLDEAINTFKLLIQKYPERSKKEMIALNLAVTYEEQKNFAKAIETLESLKDSYPKKGFIEARIKTLRERQSYLPGAKGWKK